MSGILLIEVSLGRKDRYGFGGGLQDAAEEMEPLLRAFALLAHLFFTQGTLDRHWQAREPMLEHKIHRAQLDHLHRGLFPQRPGHQHHGKLPAGVAHHREHVPAIPSRQAIIAKDQVVIARTQSPRKLLRGFNHLLVDFVACLFENAQGKPDVVVAVVDEQHAKRARYRRGTRLP